MSTPNWVAPVDDSRAGSDLNSLASSELTADAPTAPPVTSTEPPSRVERYFGLASVRNTLLVAWAIATVIIIRERGIPFERIQIMGWIAVGLVAFSIGRNRGGVLRVLIDFVPIAVILIGYDLSRGIADTLGMPVQMESLVRIERTLFNGTIPTVWAQERLGPYTGPARWWEVPVALSYLSHFVVAFVVLGALWARSRDLFVEFRNRFMLVTAAGLATYILVPAAPPWMAADNGLIGNVERVGLRGLRLLHIDIASPFVKYGSEFGNLVAALPSLHAGWSAVISFYFIRHTPRWVWPLLLAYPALMGVSLVISGEHYVIDVLLGYIYAAVAIVVLDRIPDGSARAALDRLRPASRASK